MTILGWTGRSRSAEGALAGCDLSIVRAQCGGSVACHLTLDHCPATYTRDLDDGELRLLARLNPDDGEPAALGALLDDVRAAVWCLTGADPHKLGRLWHQPLAAVAGRLIDQLGRD